MKFIVETNRIVAQTQDGIQEGEITWSQAGESLIIIDHTYVDDAFRGQGIAALLVAEAVTFAREHQKKVMPLCPFAKKEFDTKKEYQDLLN